VANVWGRESLNKVRVTCSPDKSTETETRENLPALDKKGDEEKLDTGSVSSEESFDSFSQSHSYNSLSYLPIQLNIYSSDIRIH